jgi:hypothetical protein
MRENRACTLGNERAGAATAHIVRGMQGCFSWVSQEWPRAFHDAMQHVVAACSTAGTGARRLI